MAKKKRTTTTKSTAKNKKTTKTKKERKDLVWLFLKIFFVVVLISVVLYYMVRPTSNSRKDAEELPSQEQVCNEKSFELSQNIDKKDEALPIKKEKIGLDI